MELIYQKNYEEFKKELDAEISGAAEGFVRIGYLLKVARDTDILRESQYEDVNAFAKARYGLDKTQVSRFIRINDRFSEGGNSMELQDRYRGYGSSKLTLMLSLPDEVNDLLTPEYSKAEIQTIKDEVDEERKITDIEVLLEQKTAPEGDILFKVIFELGRAEPELYTRVYGGDAKAEMLPDDEKIYSVRVPGEGRFLLKLDDSEARLVNLRTGETEAYAWTGVRAAWESLMDAEKSPKESWEQQYGTAFPEKEKEPEVAPVQRKESKVTAAKSPNPTEPEKEAVTETPENVPEEPEIVTETPESVTEAPEIVTEATQSVTEEPESATETQESVTEVQESAPEETATEEPETIPETQSATERKPTTEERYRAAVSDLLKELCELWKEESPDYAAAKILAESLISQLERLEDYKDMQEMEAEDEKEQSGARTRVSAESAAGNL